MISERRAYEPRPALLLGALLLAAACGGGDHPAATPEAAEVAATTARAERLERPSEVEIFGVVEAARTATISTRVMAMVTAVEVQAGDAVAAGQLLLTIDPQAADGQLAQARGALAQARAGLALAQRNHERFEALAAANASSELELDTARMQHEQARGAVQQAEGAVAAAAAVAADSRVVAPFAGRIARRMVDVGDLAAPGRPLLAVESEGTRRLALRVPESAMSRSGLALGDALPVRVDARPDLGTLSGTVVEVAAGADPGSHSFEVEVALPVEGIPSGASGRARIEIGRRSVVAVPEAAVLEHGGLSLLLVGDAEGRVGSRVVTLGESLDGDRVEVLSGLAGGETVLLGLPSVPPAGTRYRVAEAAAESSR